MPDIIRNYNGTTKTILLVATSITILLIVAIIVVNYRESQNVNALLSEGFKAPIENMRLIKENNEMLKENNRLIKESLELTMRLNGLSGQR